MSRTIRFRPQSWSPPNIESISATGSGTSLDSGAVVLTENLSGTLVGTSSDSGTPQAVGGSGVTLTGSGFGTKSTVAPVAFDRFEDNAVDDTVAQTNLEVMASHDALNCRVAGDHAHAGSKALRMVYPETSTVNFPRVGHSLPGSLDVYLGHWVRWEVAVGTAGTGVFKWMRSGCNASYSGEPSCKLTPRSGISCLVDGTCNRSTTSGYFNCDGSFHDFTFDEQMVAGQWHWVEQKFRLSTVGQLDGFHTWLCNGVVNGDQQNVATRPSCESTADTLDWCITAIDGLDSYASDTEYHMHIDEVLIDSTFARVILTDAQTYGSSTNWAPQKPSSWSDSEIQIDSPNWSDFASGATVYFHVFDAEDNHVSAHQRTVP